MCLRGFVVIGVRDDRTLEPVLHALFFLGKDLLLITDRQPVPDPPCDALKLRETLLREFVFVVSRYREKSTHQAAQYDYRYGDLEHTFIDAIVPEFSNELEYDQQQHAAHREHARPRIRRHINDHSRAD